MSRIQRLWNMRAWFGGVLFVCSFVFLAAYGLGLAGRIDTLDTQRVSAESAAASAESARLADSVQTSLEISQLSADSRALADQVRSLGGDPADVAPPPEVRTDDDSPSAPVQPSISYDQVRGIVEQILLSNPGYTAQQVISAAAVLLAENPPPPGPPGPIGDTGQDAPEVGPEVYLAAVAAYCGSAADGPCAGPSGAEGPAGAPGLSAVPFTFFFTVPGGLTETTYSCTVTSAGDNPVPCVVQINPEE